MSAPVSMADRAVDHLIRAIINDGRKAYLLGYGTESFNLLTAAYAERNGLDVEKYRDEVWSACAPEKVVSAA